ncbi:MAG: alcohol dehydrogenase catalytic domain-containing protein [Bryobacterales bacterium]
MKAARLTQARSAIDVVDAPEPEPKPGEALVRVEACGLCRSDLFIQSLEKLPQTPLTLGHEGIGVVESVGAGVIGLQPGDRVGLTYLYGGCGECEVCAAGRPELCARQRNRGYHVDGAFAALALAQADCVARVPAGLAAEVAAPLCCAGWTAYRAVKTAALEPGCWLAVWGAGGLGQLAIQLASLEGWRVVAVDPNQANRRLAAEAGAEITLDPETDDLRKQFKSLGGVHGAISFVAAGDAVRNAARVVRRGGCLVLVGLAPETIELPLLDVVLKGLRIEGSFLGRQADLDAVFALAEQGRLRPAVQTCSLDGVPAAFEEMREGRLAGRMVAVLG